MRLPTLNNLITLLAVTQTTTAFALPRPENSTLASAEDYHVVEKRAYNAQLTIPVLSSTTLETWHGTKQYLGIFGTGLSDDEVMASAKQTYETLKGRLPATLLVSVIFVPRGGLAAGTIWRARDEIFEATARTNAPAFWEAVPGDEQRVLPNMRNEHKWHSEAVATRQAEMQYKHLMVEGSSSFPVGTRITTYGRISGGNPGPRAACSPNHSSVTRPCSVWLGRLRIRPI